MAALRVQPRELDDVIDHRVESVDFADDARGRVVGGVILCGGLGQCSDAGQRRSKVVGEPPDRFSPGVLDLAGPLSVGSLGGCLTLHGAGSARQDQADEECKRCARCQHNEQCLGGVIVDEHLPGGYGHAGGKRGDDDERCCDGSHDGLGAGKRRHDCGAGQPDARCGEDRQNDGVLVRGQGVPAEPSVSQRYPLPNTVASRVGRDGSVSTFSRRRRTCTVTVEGSPTFHPQTSRMRSSRL